MNSLADHRFLLIESDSEVLLRHLEKWVPRVDDLGETVHEADLFKFLMRCFPDVPMTAQYGIAKGRADIVIEDYHVLELKLGFTDVGEFDRCIGQLERYRQKWVSKDRGAVYMIVIGESDPEFRSMLHHWIEEANSKYWTKKFFLVEKLGGQP